MKRHLGDEVRVFEGDIYRFEIQNNASYASYLHLEKTIVFYNCFFL